MTATPLASLPAVVDEDANPNAVREEEEEKEEDAFVTLELRAELDSLPDADARELVERLSSKAGPSRLVLLHDGLTCSGHNTSKAEEDGTDKDAETPLCLPVALHAAYVAFNLHETKVKDTPSSDVDEGEFLQALLSPGFVEAMQRCSRIQDEWKQPTSTLEALIELEPFNHMFGDLVLLSHHELSNAGILESFQRVWAEDALWLPIVAGILTYQSKALLCLRVQTKPSLFAYIIFDNHTRTGSDHGPAFIVHQTREGAARYLLDLWKESPRGSTKSIPQQPEESKFSLHILLPARRPRSFVPPQEAQPETAVVVPSASEVEDAAPEPIKFPPKPQEPSAVAEDSEDVRARTPSPSAPSPKAPPNLRSAPSHNRLQSEFGWQLGLKDVRIVTPLKEKVEEEALNVQDGAAEPEPEPAPKPEHKPEPAPTSSQTPMKAHSKDTSASKLSVSPKVSNRDLSKKDFGWQMALQEEVGAMTLPMSPKSGVTTFSEADSRHKPQSSLGGSTSVVSFNNKAQNSSNTNLSQKSGLSNGGRKSPNSNASSSRAEIERQKPVRADIGWQMGLAAKSMTLPLSPRRDVEFNKTELNPSSNNLQQSSHTVGYAAPSASPLAASEFGALKEDKSAEKADEEETKPDLGEGSSDGNAGEEGNAATPDVVDCEYCFGPAVVDELITVASGCGHKVYITLDLMKNTLGFSESDIERFQQLEFQTLPVTLKCPTCKSEATVPRQDVMTSKTLKCSSQACYRSWCRGCHQEVRDGEVHMCKSKMQRREKMLGKKGSRYCPGCQTLAKKPVANDNHMVCSSTLCGMHFCFKCGEVIADTVKGQDIERYAFIHYRGCTQFEDGDKCCIQ
ncbi:hypothetical protein MD484_g5784, partial [Candolleomyces efflorescens]